MDNFDSLMKSCKIEIFKYSQRLYSKGLVSATGGNISMKLGDRILITASNISLGDIELEEIVLCDLEGNLLYSDTLLKPSKEINLHIAVYKHRPEIKAVLHAHPSYATAFSLLDEKLILFSQTAKSKLRNVEIISQAQAGSLELASNVEYAVKQYTSTNNFLMKGHGILSLGLSVKECFEHTELLEDASKIAILLKSL